MSRRSMLKQAGAVTTATWGQRLEAFAGPFQVDEAHLVPADKKFSAAWLQSLTDRGKPAVLRGDELKFVGMPVGGCFAGTVYLGGDGRLWNWDVFNQHHQGTVAHQAKYGKETLNESSGANYVDPPSNVSPFRIQFSCDGVPLESGHWDETTFLGQYPVGTVTYTGHGLRVVLEAFSPFIPLDIERSSYPAVVMKYTVTNLGSTRRKVVVACACEHPALLYSKDVAEHVTLTVARRQARDKSADTGSRWTGASFETVPDATVRLAPTPDWGSFAVGVTEGEVMETPGTRPSATVSTPLDLAPGQTASRHVFVAWHFPHAQVNGFKEPTRRWYGTRWSDAGDVLDDLVENWSDLEETTFKWRDTWYDSTLPYWLLDRTFANTSILATNTCYRFDDGRFWFWEGVGCCHGCCTHVWGYAQAIGRVFPEVERYLREKVDFGRFFHADTGAIDYRGEFGRSVAHDGQAGCILRAYREHLMSPDDDFLKGVYPQVKKATQLLMTQDPDRDGILEGGQYNTLDAAWYGKLAWISGLYLAAVKACGAMAGEMGDTAFAAECSAVCRAGEKSMVAQLFDGEYFVNITDPAHRDRNNTNKGCHIDQLYGQQWAHQLGLGGIVPAQEARSAMAALFRHNFAPDVGVYRRGMKTIPGGRWYALPGEAGLIMTTFPKGGADQAVGKGQDAWAGMYFNECMSGFEHQAAAGMIYEGLVTEGLAVERAVHDRYAPHKRNPYNEIECSDHYGRAMASYGVFVALTGFYCHGPRNAVSFRPRTGKAKNRFPFITANGWGTAHVDRQPDGTWKATMTYRHQV
ncbi:MAG: hypothetical protein KF857_11330 [Fimbriimonadaceae bacterium]|nr:hypothetical protein [Fimbriimonadaceae bacterium]